LELKVAVHIGSLVEACSPVLGFIFIVAVRKAIVEDQYQPRALRSHYSID